MLPLTMPSDFQIGFQDDALQSILGGAAVRERIVLCHELCAERVTSRDQILLAAQQVAKDLVANVFVAAFANHLVAEAPARNELSPGFQPALLAGRSTGRPRDA